MGFSILFFTALFFLHRKRSVDTWQRAIVTVNNRCLFFALPSSNSSNSGTAVISLLFSSAASCPNTAFALLAHALTIEGRQQYRHTKQTDGFICCKTVYNIAVRLLCRGSLLIHLVDEGYQFFFDKCGIVHPVPSLKSGLYLLSRAAFATDFL